MQAIQKGTLREVGSSCIIKKKKTLSIFIQCNSMKDFWRHTEKTKENKVLLVLCFKKMSIIKGKKKGCFPENQGTLTQGENVFLKPTFQTCWGRKCQLSNIRFQAKKYSFCEDSRGISRVYFL